jgi:hypothetical protein
MQNNMQTNHYASEEERLLSQLETIRKDKLENEKNQKLKETELKRFHITEKIKLIFYLNSFQVKYSQLNDSLKPIVFKEIKSFVEIDPDENFKLNVATITEVTFDWNKLATCIDYDGCKRLIKMFNNIGAFNVDQIKN